MKIQRFYSSIRQNIDFVKITRAPVHLRSERIMQKTRRATCAWFSQRTLQMSKEGY